MTDNNASIGSLRQDLGKVQKQFFEMENINESLEQRIDQLRAQRELSIQLMKTGQNNELRAELEASQSRARKFHAKQMNMIATWDDQLAIKLRELDEAMRRSSEETANKQVQRYLQEVKDKNEDIVRVNQQKEEIESAMRNKVDDDELRQLQSEHSKLIKEYEEIIKSKIAIFSEMINNLKGLSDGNLQAIKNEEDIAGTKLDIEIWEKDIYQKKRVEMDHYVEIEQAKKFIDREN